MRLVWDCDTKMVCLSVSSESKEYKSISELKRMDSVNIAEEFGDSSRWEEARYLVMEDVRDFVITLLPKVDISEIFVMHITDSLVNEDSIVVLILTIG